MRLLPSSFYLDDMFDNIMQKKSNMQCDIYEQENQYVIEIDIPGFQKENINIDVNNEYLTVTAEKEEIFDDNKKYIRQERNFGKYQRSFYLGDLDRDNVVAQFNNGVLKISVPKKEVIDNKRTIEIE